MGGLLSPALLGLINLCYQYAGKLISNRITKIRNFYILTSFLSRVAP